MTDFNSLENETAAILKAKASEIYVNFLSIEKAWGELGTMINTTAVGKTNPEFNMLLTQVRNTQMSTFTPSREVVFKKVRQIVNEVEGCNGDFAIHSVRIKAMNEASQKATDAYLQVLSQYKKLIGK